MIVDSAFYQQEFARAEELVKDKDDSPYIALALAMDAPIWTHDRHFFEQKRVKVLTNKDLLKRTED